VAVDASGRVYLAAGQIYVYSPEGQLIEAIDVPERPTQIVFGGKDGRTLFICARSSLYAVRMKTPGALTTRPWVAEAASICPQRGQAKVTRGQMETPRTGPEDRAFV